MHLFKCQWLQESGARIAVSYREPGFGPRYGRQANSPRPCGRAVKPRHDNILVGDFERQRQILRAMARYDHAA